MKIKIWINDYVDYMKYERGFMESTINGRRKILSQFQRFLSSRPLDTQAIREFIRQKAEKKLSPYSLNDYIRDIKCFCKYLFEMAKIPQDYAYPIKKFKLPQKLPKILTLQELSAIIYCPQRHYQLSRVKKTYDFIFELLVKTGMRRNEICMLDCGDFKFDEAIIHVRFAKGGKQRYVPLPPDMIDRFQQWFKERKAEADKPAFASRDNNRMKGENIRFEIKRRAKAAGITRNVFPHMLRHSFITEMLRKDVAVAKVARIVGHANPMITMNTYEHLVIDDLKKAAARHPLINPAFQPAKKKEKKPSKKSSISSKNPVKEKNKRKF